MLDTIYCGYIKFSIVIIFIVVIRLLILIRGGLRVFLTNFDVLIVSVKIFSSGFFGD